MATNIPELPRETSQAIANYAQEARNDSTGQRTERYTQDLPRARGLLSGGESFNSGLSYGDQATREAIRSRYSRDYSRGEDRLRLEMRKAGQDDYLKKLEIASNLANEEHQLNQQRLAMIRQQKRAKRAARGAALGSVLGIVGGVVGGVVGGPAGAAGGYAIGSGVGGAIGEGT